jgi:hypothetical protein
MEARYTLRSVDLNFRIYKEGFEIVAMYELPKGRDCFAQTTLKLL